MQYKIPYSVSNLHTAAQLSDIHIDGESVHALTVLFMNAFRASLPLMKFIRRRWTALPISMTMNMPQVCGAVSSGASRFFLHAVSVT